MTVPNSEQTPRFGVATRRGTKVSVVKGRPSMVERQIRNVFAQRTSITSATVFVNQEVQDVSNIFDCRRLFKKSKKQLKPSQIEHLKNELTLCCLTHIQDSYRVHLNRLKGLEILDQLVTHSSLDKITPELAIHMVWACLSCIHHFLLRIKSDNGVIQWLRRRQARRSIKIYDKLLIFLTPTYYTVVLNAIITFYEEANIWDIEYFCANLLQRLLSRSDEKNRTESIHEIISLVENSTLTNAMASRQILQVLFDIEESLNWSLMNDKLTDRFLDIYYRSLTPEGQHDYNYESLEKGLETCIRAMSMHFTEKQLMFMIKWMLEVTELEKISEDNLLNFGSLLEHITALYSAKAYKRPLPEQVFPQIIKLISSNNLVYSLLGNRVLHDLIDRCNNKLKINTPRLFFRNSHYNIVLNQYNTSDKLLFQRYRELFHKTFVAAVIKHGIHKYTVSLWKVSVKNKDFRIHLENIYVSIVLFLVEVPCGYTAAAAVCLAMSIQEAALESKNIELTHAHRLHATVVSIMSLVCYIHKADVFYEYVSTIIERRANLAPHLNPPLKMNYKYAQHHVLWNKPELFFEDWEARYGLWKCFKDKHKDMIVAHI